MISFDTIFEADGRTWLVTPELSLVPADRTRVYRKTSFQGVPLGDGLTLPIAWIRHHARPKFRRDRAGHIAATDATWALRTAVGLTGRKVEQDGRQFWETIEPGSYIEKSDATVVAKSSRLPPRCDPTKSGFK